MRIGNGILFASMFLFVAGSLWADGPSFEILPGRDLPPLVRAQAPPLAPPVETSPEVLAERDGVLVTRATAQDLALGSWLLESGDGGGGDIVDDSFLLIQTRFLDSNCAFSDLCAGPCNQVLLLWDENTENPEGVAVFVDDNPNPLGVLPGLPPDQLPGTNGVNIVNMSPGVHTFTIEESNTGDTATADIVVIDSQPFADVEGLGCTPAGLEAGGRCSLIATWTNPGPVPDALGVLLNGAVQTALAGDSRGTLLGNLTSGTYTVEVVGLLETEDGTYRGCYPQTTCTIDCEDIDTCFGTVGVYTAQRTYGATPDLIEVDVFWLNGEVFYQDGVSAFVDDAPLGTLPCDIVEGTCPVAATIGGVAPGVHTIGIRGECGDPRGPSAIDEATIEILTETPHTNPIEGGVQCEFDPGDGAPGSGVLIASWVNGDPSVFIDAFIRQGPDLFFLGTLPGNATATPPITGMTDPEVEVLELVFYRQIDGAAYASEPVTCSSSSGEFFVRGICNGIGDTPQITSAIFLLSWLFLGAQTPPCEEACDADDDSIINLTDAVYVLNFLFLGGPPPAGWGSTDAVCEEVVDGMNCETPREDCPLPEEP